MKIIIGLDRLLNRLENILVVSMFSLLVCVIFGNVLARNFFDTSFSWGMKFAPQLVLWLALLGSTMVIRKRGYIRLEIFMRFCPAAFQYYSNVVTNMFNMMVMGILFCSSIGFVINEVALFGGSGWLSIAFPMFFLSTLFRFFINLCHPFDMESNREPTPASKS